MTERVLFVDDEPNVLDALRRLLRRKYEFDMAEGGEQGLALLDQNEYAVIVSDMRMPGMTGDVFLARAHEKQPTAIQMILSGHADLTSTVSAVNEGSIFRFLIKPADREVLTGAVDEALRQYRLIESEKILLEKTLSGAVEALTEVLSLVSPAATRRTNLVVDLVQRLAPEVDLEADWQLRLSSLLGSIGFAAVPADVVEKADSGKALTPAEQDMVARHPHIAATLLAHIPRLEGVAGIITAQAGLTAPPAGLETQVTVLDLATQVAEGVLLGHDQAAVVGRLRSAATFDGALLDALDEGVADPELVIAELRLSDVQAGMTLRSDVYAETDVILATTGTVLGATLIERLHNFDRAAGVRQPILVEYCRGQLGPVASAA